MSRQELIGLVERIMAGQGSEQEHDALVQKLMDSVVHPHVTDLIYYANPELSAEEVVDAALAYRSIAL
ncbi:bacteriocin immunity protein [Streptomyces sp. WMMC897]|nr:bacteriocin immunity protein [Streptomyces sp. WMMC897]MCZ7416984.1 bacteriocin immunity protein [Streptomyces sp. WMMC897]